MRIFQKLKTQAVGVIILLGVSCIQAFCETSPISPEIDHRLDVYAAPARLVRLPDGRLMNLFCVGKGTPTVVLESGLGDGGTRDWNKIQAQLGANTRTCSYDRAGVQFSQSGPFPRSAARITQDLHDLLVAAHEIEPLVLVGHSQGGIYVRNYARTFPRSVAGMVLIESAALGQFDRFPTGSKMKAATFAHFEECETKGRQKLIHMGDTCIGNPPPTFSAKLKEVMKKNNSKPELYETLISELRQSLALTPENDTKGFGSMPLAVLYVHHPEAPENDEVWESQQKEYATLSKRSSVKLVANSGHFVQLDQPAVAINAINKVVENARADQRGH